MVFKNNNPTLKRFVSQCSSYMGRRIVPFFYASIKHEFCPNSFLFALLCLPDASNKEVLRLFLPNEQKLTNLMQKNFKIYIIKLLTDRLGGKEAWRPTQFHNDFFCIFPMN